uniref:Uncharacterized protein n=1 Tax=Trypanosoma congolense (strain IL3000) TaxID=1068625 RepID=G0URX4_TRYCI|nr:hypothetical protein, unlikely [Trypanosoma congolense IL3000]
MYIVREERNECGRLLCGVSNTKSKKKGTIYIYVVYFIPYSFSMAILRGLVCMRDRKVCVPVPPAPMLGSVSPAVVKFVRTLRCKLMNPQKNNFLNQFFLNIFSSSKYFGMCFVFIFYSFILNSPFRSYYGHLCRC